MTTKTTKKTWIHPETQAAFEATVNSQFEFAPVRASSPHGRVQLYAQFAQRLEHLRALPRRARRALERSWKKPLAAIALLLTLGQGTALAATINVDANTPPEIKANGKCSLVEAIINANDDVATHRDCTAGSGNDTIVLPRNSQQTISSFHGLRPSLGRRGCDRDTGSDEHPGLTSALPLITSSIVIEGHGSTFTIGSSSEAAVIVERTGDFTLNDTTITGMGVVNLGKLNTVRTVIKDSRYSCGLYNVGGSAQLTDTTIQQFYNDMPRGDYNGVGIDNLDGRVELVRSVVTENSSYNGTGGLYNGANGTLVLRNSAVTSNFGNGDVSSSPGGVTNLGNLYASNTTISNNGAVYNVGGLFNEGTAVLTDVRIEGNQSTRRYGGIGGIDNPGTITLTRCTIANNNGYSGGGFDNWGNAKLIDSIVAGNVTGGSWRSSFTNSGTILISGSTISGNSSEAAGSGFRNTGRAELVNSTVSGNVNLARERYFNPGYDVYRGVGGGVYNEGQLTLTNTTISGNKSIAAAGIFNVGTATITRSIVSGNLVSEGPREIENLGGTVMVNGFNLFGHTNSAGVKNVTLGNTDIVPAKPLSGILLPLAHNSSKTKTHALAINSPALNASPADDGCPAKDQRGVPRPQGAGCDIGAFEGSAVMCNGVVSTHVGTSGNDSIYGTPGPDVIAGLSGNDTLQGLDGDDMICGGSGKDSLIGGKGVDALMGDAGDDVLRGQAGDDIVNGGPGTDTCDGGTNGAAGDVAAQCENVVNVP